MHTSTIYACTLHAASAPTAVPFYWQKAYVLLSPCVSDFWTAGSGSRVLQIHTCTGLRIGYAKTRLQVVFAVGVARRELERPGSAKEGKSITKPGIATVNPHSFDRHHLQIKHALIVAAGPHCKFKPRFQPPNTHQHRNPACRHPYALYRHRSQQLMRYAAPPSQGAPAITGNWGSATDTRQDSLG